jgi:Pyruvate/2-oxoacid:ferredoxin oxidoreductase gamma subunit/ribosomal protein S18 acetylase RimI-like enzyme
MAAQDAREIAALFRIACEEMADFVPHEHLESYLHRYDEAHLKEMLHGREALALVSETEGRIAGFLLGSSAAGIGTVHWLRTHPDYRDKGYAYSLYFAAMDEFARRGCFKAMVYVFPDAREIIRFFEQQGFSAGELIGEEYFGIALKPLVKLLRAPRPEEQSRSIVLWGSAGQGIKLMGHALAAILASLGKHVALNVTYPTSVRAGVVRADIIYSDECVDMPFIEEADLLLRLAPVKKTDQVRAKKVIRDREVAQILSDEYHREEGDVEEVSFKMTALKEFGSPLFINMVALGKLLRHLGIAIDKVDWEQALPAKYLDKNILAIKYGYGVEEG